MKPGDIVNEDGDILLERPARSPPGRDHHLMRGRVIVTLAQADAAKPYGWSRVDGTEDLGMVQIERK